MLDILLDLNRHRNKRQEDKGYRYYARKGISKNRRRTR